MTCVYKEYEVNIKWYRSKTPVRNEVFIGSEHKSCYLVDEWTFGGGSRVF